MRSRFSAFAVGDEAYLRRTWDRSTRPRRIGLDPAVTWTRLEIVGSTLGGLFDVEGAVEFRASHTSIGGGSGVLQENSAFHRIDGKWLYLAAL
jgi:SEC-C motif-containing protein